MDLKSEIKDINTTIIEIKENIEKIDKTFILITTQKELLGNEYKKIVAENKNEEENLDTLGFDSLYFQIKLIDEERKFYTNRYKMIKNKLYGDLTSGEESKILKGAKILIHLDGLHWTQNEFKTIGQKCQNLPPPKSKMVRDYREDVKAAVLVIQNFIDGNECKCGIYQKWVQFLPEREIEMGFLKMENEPIINKEKYQKEFDLSCLKCGTKWQSNEIEGYHYPWNEWIKK